MYIKRLSLLAVLGLMLIQNVNASTQSQGILKKRETVPFVKGEFKPEALQVDTISNWQATFNQIRQDYTAKGIEANHPAMKNIISVQRQLSIAYQACFEPEQQKEIPCQTELNNARNLIMNFDQSISPQLPEAKTPQTNKKKVLIIARPTGVRSIPNRRQLEEMKKESTIAGKTGQ